AVVYKNNRMLKTKKLAAQWMESPEGQRLLNEDLNAMRNMIQKSIAAAQAKIAAHKAAKAAKAAAEEAQPVVEAPAIEEEAPVIVINTLKPAQLEEVRKKAQAARKEARKIKAAEIKAPDFETGDEVLITATREAGKVAVIWQTQTECHYLVNQKWYKGEELAQIINLEQITEVNQERTAQEMKPLFTPSCTGQLQVTLSAARQLEQLVKSDGQPVYRLRATMWQLSSTAHGLRMYNPTMAAKIAQILERVGVILRRKANE
ncbi:MAG: hypothetical protein ACRCYZ_04150, partial [Alphaproteobacteria bacterium]